MRRWEQAPNEQRLAMVATLLTAARGAEQCLYGGHDELQTRLEATQRRVTDLDGQLQRAKEALHRLERRLAELENKVARLSPDEPAPGLGDRLDRANRRITDLTARLNHAEDTLSRARALHAATCPRATGHPCDLCGLLGVSAPAGEGTR